ncbi:uncharacterized protein [Rutidosis leptorrhynchoides]|uniref:uncharacterized protein n=1 Tax=Rutidosis leptorrhynchoides TaxID=125765 RepID=UPI003A99C081
MEASVCNRVVVTETGATGAWDWCRNPRGRALGELSELNALIRNVALNQSKVDSWKWLLSGNGVFSTKKLTDLINGKNLQVGPSNFETIRNNLVPNKVEIFVWRARRRRLAVLSELDKKGIDLHSVLCPICGFQIGGGLGTFTNLSINEIFMGNSSVQMSNEDRKLWQAVDWTCGYLIWNNRNLKLFKNKCWSSPVALSDIQVKSYEWVAKMCKTKKIDWLG